SAPVLPLLPSAGTTPVPMTIPSDLVAWWPAEDNTIDSVSGSAATLFNGASVMKEGKVGQTFVFDGVDDHVRIKDRPELHITGPMTIEAWVFPTTNDTSRNIAAK